MFKCCPLCSKCWKNVEEVLNDKNLMLCGYQPFPDEPDNSMLLFTHQIEGCGTTFSLGVADFKEYFGVTARFEEFKMGHEPDCEFRCLDVHDTNLCGNKTCKGVEVRKFLQIIKDRALGSDSKAN